MNLTIAEVTYLYFISIFDSNTSQIYILYGTASSQKHPAIIVNLIGCIDRKHTIALSSFMIKFTIIHNVTTIKCWKTCGS